MIESIFLSPLPFWHALYRYIQYTTPLLLSNVPIHDFSLLPRIILVFYRWRLMMISPAMAVNKCEKDLNNDSTNRKQPHQSLTTLINTASLVNLSYLAKASDFLVVCSENAWKHFLFFNVSVFIVFDFVLVRILLNSSFSTVMREIVIFITFL